MTDRELLKLAAKAAGIEGYFARDDQSERETEVDYIISSPGASICNHCSVVCVETIITNGAKLKDECEQLRQRVKELEYEEAKSADMAHKNLQLWLECSEKLAASEQRVAELEAEKAELVDELYRVKAICLREVGVGIVNEVILYKLKEKP